MSERPTIVVDARELKSGVPEKLAELGVRVKTSTLGVGDYSLAGDILIERRTADDFAASIFDGRLFEQASRISNVCSKPVVIVENPLHEAFQWVSNRNAVYGALAAMAFSYRFTVFQTRDSDETAQLTAVMVKHGKYGSLRYASPVVRGEGEEVELAEAAGDG